MCAFCRDSAHPRTSQLPARAISFTFLYKKTRMRKLRYTRKAAHILALRLRSRKDTTAPNVSPLKLLIPLSASTEPSFVIIALRYASRSICPFQTSHTIVKRYLKALTEEQLQARVLPQQAEPFFVHDLILCSKIEGLLKGLARDPRHVFIYARDLTYFKLHFFSGDRPSDLSHIRVQRNHAFPSG